MSALLAAWSWFAGTKAGRILLAVGVAVAALGYAFLSGRQQERLQAGNRALGRDIENRRTRDTVERAVAREPDPAERLRRDWSRD
jgi:hypothetical protein